MTPGLGFALWVNGSPAYDETSFPTGTPYVFPRKNSNGSDAEYKYHTSDGSWTGQKVALERGNDINNEPAWTANANLNNYKDSRYRFIFENNQDISIKTFSTSIKDEKTMIVGNPFMSHLDFGQFYLDNQTAIYNYYRIWNGTQFYTFRGDVGNSGFEGLDGLTTLTGNDESVNQYIAPLQAFFIDTKPNAVTIKFTPESSVMHKESKLRSGQSENAILRLHLKSGNNTSQAIVALIPEASGGYNPEEDVVKLFSPYKNIPEIYTVAEQQAIEINTVNASDEKQWIPIGIRTSYTGDMELNISGTESISNSIDIFLKDISKATEYNLRDIRSFNFEKTTENDLEGRFYLSLKNNSTTSINNQASQTKAIDIFVREGKITINSLEDRITNIRLFDISGKIYYQLKNSGKYTESFVPTTISGIFILQVETENQTENHKIIL